MIIRTWNTDFDSMALKTVVKRMLKYAPISSDFVRAAAADDTVKDYQPVPGEAPNVLDQVTIEAEPVQPQEEEIPFGDEPPKGVDPDTGEMRG